MDIFQDCGPIYVYRFTKPDHLDLKELISICKGTVTEVTRNAEIVVGCNHRDKDGVSVTPQWILDSITINRKMPFKKYLMKERNLPMF